MTESFPALAQITGLRHAFTRRFPGLPVDVEREEAIARLRPHHEEAVRSLGFDPSQLRLAEQIHGAGIAKVDAETPPMSPGVDGLITNIRGLVLGIYVADCAAVFLADRENRGIGVVHSGKKGSELGIAAAAVRRMNQEFGIQASDILVQVSPYIRPPHYEVDFAQAIRSQCLAAGVLPENYSDSGQCTASAPADYYSYRMEKGRTGRMLALLGWPL